LDKIRALRNWIFILEERMMRKILVVGLVVVCLQGATVWAEEPVMSMTNTETGEVSTVTRNADGSNTVTVQDRDGNVTSEGTPGTGALPPGTIGAVRDDPATGDRHVSIEADDNVIESVSEFDAETGITTTTNILDPTVEGGRAQYVIHPDGSQESLVTLPEDTAGAYSVDPATGDKHVSIADGEGGSDSYVIPKQEESAFDRFDNTLNKRRDGRTQSGMGRDLTFDSGPRESREHSDH